MAAVVEVKFFNSFLLKKTMLEGSTAPTPPVWMGSTGVPAGLNGSFPVEPIANTEQANSWVIEEARIRGGYNNTNVSYGARAYLVENEPKASNRINSLIYSGIFNSRTGVNDTNVFSVGEDITKSIDPANGSIQKLYAEDTNLIIFQENKVSRALIDKDAIYTAEGGGTAVSQLNLVIGQIVPYAGNFGISKNPESFAVYGYRKYFADRNRNVILRLSRDGITEISNYGMKDYFRDQFGLLNNSEKIFGAWDIYTKQYVVSMQGQNIPIIGGNSYQTLSFDESVLGWTSFYTYDPEQMFSVQSKFYSVKDSQLWQHNYETFQNNDRSIFYNQYADSNITFIFNPKPSLSKNFKTVNYEGSTGWEVSSFEGARSFELNDTSNLVYSYDEGSYTQDGITYYAGFHNKEGKYFANLVNNSSATSKEIVYGPSVTGVKGYYATVTITTDSSTQAPGAGGKVRELFAVSSDYVESSY
jgi:hypothetical protein